MTRTEWIVYAIAVGLVIGVATRDPRANESTARELVQTADAFFALLVRP